jgi:hypothetical protein
MNEPAFRPESASQTARSHFADMAAAREAITMALPMIESAVRDRSICGAGFLCIVVLDPAKTPAVADFDQAVLVEHAIGAREKWDADYAAFAREKARLSWQHGLDSHRLQTSAPHLLRAGESLLWGGVCLDGIVVGVSGAFPWYDEAFATAIAANLRAIAKRRHAEALSAGKTAAI